jgi:Txe/YoeB family toxin of Txe-Axe toxin-antitoxin module
MKPKKVVFINEELSESFNKLKEEDPLKKGLKKAIKNIQEDAFSGRNVKKELIPKEFIQKYEINNLWIYNLPNSWRMFYVITPSEEIEIIAVVLDWMNHKDYEKLFKF